MLAAEFEDIEECNVLSIEVTDTPFCWGCGIEPRKDEREDLKEVPDIIEVEEGRDLNVMMGGGLSWCHFAVFVDTSRRAAQMGMMSAEKR